MFKRANKITALVVAAASIMSVVPAMAADKVVDLGNKEGTVKQGVAYADGKYAFYGYRTDEDHTGVYYNKGGDAKDTMDSNLEDYRLENASKFDEKYAYARENSNDDEYLIDLTSGAIKTDETAEEKADSAKVQLKSELKRAQRYSSIKDSTGAITDFNKIVNGQFGQVWYQYKAEGDANASDVDNKNGISTIVKLRVPVFNDGNNVIFGGSTIKCDSTATAASTAAGQAASIAITVPDISVGSQSSTTPAAVTFNGASVGSVTGTTAADQQALNIAVLDAVRSTTDGTFDFAHATISGNVITVKDSAKTEYLGSVKTAKESKYVVKVTNATAVSLTNGTTTLTNGTAGDTTSNIVATQDALTAKAVAVVQADTGALSKTFDVKKAEYNTADGTIHVPSLQAKELLGSTVTAATKDYTSMGTIAGTNSTTTPGGLVKYTGFTDADGKYIDANYVANMYVFSKEKGRAVKVENFGEENTDAKLTVNLDTLEAIDQDKDYIYAIAKVDVTGDGALQGTQYFLQKISKERDGKHDGAYLPKSVTSYEININETYDNGDTKDAAKALLNASFDGHDTLLGAQVIGGNTIIVTRADTTDKDNDNIKVYKLEMKNSVKADVNGSGFLKTDVDAPLLKKTGDSDQDVRKQDFNNSDEDEGIQGIVKVGSLNGHDVYRHPEVSFDVTGNTWVLNKGDIVKFNGTDKKTMYTVDRGMNAIDVYDDNSLIAWDMDGKVYTTPGEGKKVTEDNGVVVNPDTNKDKFFTGWGTDGKYYEIVSGVSTAATNKWVSDAGKWYFIDASGAKKTGWYQNASGTWYLLGTDGAMLTGWQQDGGNWYYLNPINTSGAMVTGWFQDTTGTWYYTDGSGKMLSNTTVGGYTLGANGAWVK